MECTRHNKEIVGLRRWLEQTTACYTRRGWIWIPNTYIKSQALTTAGTHNSSLARQSDLWPASPGYSKLQDHWKTLFQNPRKVIKEHTWGWPLASVCMYTHIHVHCTYMYNARFYIRNHQKEKIYTLVIRKGSSFEVLPSAI